MINLVSGFFFSNSKFIMQRMRRTRSRVLLNVISALVLLVFFYDSSFVPKRNLGSGFQFHHGIRQSGVIHGRVLQESHEISLNVSNHFDGTVENGEKKLMDPQVCAEIFDHKGYASHCDYLIAHPDCASDGYLNYIKFFYCDCKNYSFFGYLVLGTWLIILFYLLGNTASDYFCCSLEKLSDLLEMSPTVAGVTLLPLGNGAPDVFASIAAFMGTDSGDVGLNSVLGAAVFVTCVVVGVISICIANKRIQIDRKCFIRDICFFLFTIMCLALILVIGEVNIWGAMAFVSIYVGYAFFVAVDEILLKKGSNLPPDGLTPLLPVAGSLFSHGGEENESIHSSLLSSDNGDHPSSPKLPHWVWKSNVAIFSDYVKANMEDSPSPMWGWTDEDVTNEGSSSSFSKLWSLLEMPLSVPRRLTIPIVEEDRWSKTYGVGSAFFAPVLLACLWNTQENVGALSGKLMYFAGFGVGSILGLLAFFCTSNEHPPRRFLLPWVLGGFFMSIVWFYVIANELVSLLVTMGIVLGIRPSILALTVLAWGNSMGDLVSNTALAMNDRNGAQIAMSGSYAGPMFNTLVGLGVSLLLGASYMGSGPYIIPRDRSLFITMGFLAAGLIWSLIVLPCSDMQPNKVLGVGLITIYLIFLSLRIGSTALGSGSLDAMGVRPLWI